MGCRERTTAVDTSSVSSDRGHEDYSSPFLISHSFYNALYQDKGSFEVDVESIFEFFKWDLPITTVSY